MKKNKYVSLGALKGVSLNRPPCAWDEDMGPLPRPKSSARAPALAEAFGGVWGPKRSPGEVQRMWQAEVLVQGDLFWARLFDFLWCFCWLSLRPRLRDDSRLRLVSLGIREIQDGFIIHKVCLKEFWIKLMWAWHGLCFILDKHLHLPDMSQYIPYVFQVWRQSCFKIQHCQSGFGIASPGFCTREKQLPGNNGNTSTR